MIYGYPVSSIHPHTHPLVSLICVLEVFGDMDETQQYQQKTEGVGGGQSGVKFKSRPENDSKEEERKGKTLPRTMEQPILSKTDGQTGDGGGGGGPDKCGQISSL